MGNARLNDVVDELVPADVQVPFLCECADEACNARIELERIQWQSVAARTNHFVIVPGHARTQGEVVVGSIEGFEIVRKPA